MCTTGEADPSQLLRAGLSGLAYTDLLDLNDEQVRSALPQLLTAVNQLAALTAAVVGTFDTRGLSEVDGQHTTRTWLTAFGRMSQGAATSWLNRARLQRELPALAAAAATGQVSAEHLAKVKELADRVGVKAVTDFDQILADLAAAANPAQVAKACERIAAHLDPDGKAPDPDEDFARRELSLSRQGAMTYLRGRLDPEAGAALHTALDALMKPATADDLRTAPQRHDDALGRPGPTNPQPRPTAHHRRRAPPPRPAHHPRHAAQPPHLPGPWYLGGRTDVDELLLLCRWHHSRVHEGAWRIELDHTTGEVRVYRPNGEPYELGPSQPWLSPNTRRGDPTYRHDDDPGPSP